MLIVEHQNSCRFLAERLLADYGLDFTWRHAQSAQELRDIAAEFDPAIVYCADEMPTEARCAALDILRLLSPGAAEVLIVQVGDARSVAPLLGEAQPATEVYNPLPEPERLAGPWRKALPSLLRGGRDAVALADAAGWITYANIQACRMLGGSGERFLGSLLADESDFPSDQRPHRLAFFDAFTALPTPVHVSELAARAMSFARGDYKSLPVVGLNLQGLRMLNEAEGPALGDKVLDIVCAELRSGAADCGMIAPLGTDDVLVVLPPPSHPADAAVSVRPGRSDARFFEAREAREARAPEPVAAAATGAATPPDAAAVREETATPATAAPAAPAPPAPPAAGEAYEDHPFQPAPSLAAQAPRSGVEAGLDEALRRHAIGVHYQPQFELATGRGCGVEALCRWFLTSGDSIAPAVFIPAAERAGMVGTLGAYVLKAACHTAAAWKGRDVQALTLSVNISTLQINEEFTQAMAEILKASGFPAQRLELEIAESALLADDESTLKWLTHWKEQGVRIAVTHSGDNYSNLRYLSKLPVNRLKLDKSLIHRMTSDTNTAAMVSALVALGPQLGIDVTAEGVETEAQLQMLNGMGCRQAQGFLFGRPMPPSQVLVVLRKPWGNLPRTVPRPAPAVASLRAS
jgi:EAL domain-containing protein (putative c-di-GMP-specific phosphodiesterase class I)/GGDEF domain-containing protein